MAAGGEVLQADRLAPRTPAMSTTASRLRPAHQLARRHA